jgi:RNA polymerase sigma-70 factor, ECF subfamily
MVAQASACQTDALAPAAPPATAGSSLPAESLRNFFDARPLYRWTMTRERRLLEDERLVIEAAQADPRRFTELYEDNFERVYAFVVGRVGDRSEAQDLTSEVFHQALKNLKRFEWRGVPFAAWLYKIASNAIADRAQRLAREQALPAPDPPPPEETYEQTERLARLFRTMKDLPNDQRRVVEMRFAEEKSIREIAAELRRSEGAVKQLQFRALQSLRERMGEQDD